MSAHKLPTVIRKRIDELERLIDVEHPEHRSAESVQAALGNPIGRDENEPGARGYIDAWILPLIHDIQRFDDGDIDGRALTAQDNYRY